MDSKRKSRASSETDSETESAVLALGKRAQDGLLPHDGSKKRARKTREEKAAILQFVDDGGSHSAAAERFGVSRAALTKIVKERDTATKSRRTEDAQERVETAEMPSVASEVQAKDAVEVFGASLEDASSSHSPVDTALPEAMSVEMVISTEAAVDAPVLTVDGDTTGFTPPTGTRLKKGRRVRKTNLEKMEILAFVDQGGSQGAAAEKFGVSRTAVTKMVKERAAISAQALVESSTSSRKVLQYQHKLSIIEDMLYKWQVQVELDAPTLKITGDLLQSKAMEFRNKILADYSSELSDEIILSLTDFKASNGWLHRYMQRRSIRSLPKNEAATVAVSPLPSERTSNDQRILRIRELLLTVLPACIWNLDQIFLRYRTASARLDSVINMDARSLERISIAMAVSASGEKLQLQVVGKDPNPKSLAGVDTLSSYGIQYRDHIRSSHDSSAIVDFIQAMNDEAKARKQVWYLVLDNSTAHVAAAHALNPTGSNQDGFRLDAMVLLFLPPGPTKDTQPLHQDIVRSFKLQYRHEMLQHLVHEYEQSPSVSKKSLETHSNGGEAVGEGATNDDARLFDVYAHTNLRNVFSWLQKAWGAVPSSLIRQAWSASLFLSAAVPGDREAASAYIGEGGSERKMYEAIFTLLKKAPALRKMLGLDLAENVEQFMIELLEFDRTETNGSDELAKDDEIVIESLSAQGLLRDAQRVLVLESIVKDEISPLPTLTEANSAVARLLRFMSQDNDSILTLGERRTGRANLLILQRLLLKVCAREGGRENTRDFTV